MNEPLIIAGVYQIISPLGSGGGGVVYLAEHLRLNKKVVLKADKRTPSSKLDSFRREVDSLKNLSHTYIPQVYDFVVEDGTVYTVMDYIEGESFDRPLKRGECFSQVDVIRWSCQLLDALDYLHGRPPHGILHADIKPANVMLTPEGDVRLIDYNIALALGAEGAVSVGRSFGYASPEHYNIEYSKTSETRGLTADAHEDVSTDVSEEDEEAYLSTDLESGGCSESANESTSSGKKILLDVRSDIYSLGATLYHIVSGKRPAQKADEVEPIVASGYSTAVLKIISKAMHPDPDMRYQSAKEMLYDFEHLWDRDIRTVRYHQRVRILIVVWSLLLFTGASVTFVGMKQLQNRQEAYTLSEYSSNALRQGNVGEALDYALRALPTKRTIFTPPDTAQAQKALTDALAVYDLSDGFKEHATVELSSAPMMLRLSKDGTKGLAVCADETAIFDIQTSEILKRLPMKHSALAQADFLDDDRVLYAGREGLSLYQISEDRVLWTAQQATSFSVSADRKTVAAVYKEDVFASVYETDSGKMKQRVDFGGKHQRVLPNDVFANPRDNLLVLNEDASRLAVSFEDGSLRVYHLRDSQEDLELMDSDSGYTHFEGGFFGRYFAFSATNPKSSVFSVIDTQEAVQTGGFESAHPFSVDADEDGIIVQTQNLLVKIDPVTGEQQSLGDTSANIVHFATKGMQAMMMTDEPKMLFFGKGARLISGYTPEYPSDMSVLSSSAALIGSMNSPLVHTMRLEMHEEAHLMSYDVDYPHQEARYSTRHQTVMLFSFQGFRLYDLSGKMITELQIPDGDYIYDQQYRRNSEEDHLEVIYNDGRVLCYSAKDGRKIQDIIGERPDLSLDEEFFTEKWRIESPLHGTPKIYDRKTGKLLRELDKDAYLSYIVEEGNYIIADYITSEKKRVAKILDSSGDSLAELPYLCDVVGGELIFDYPTGVIRRSHIYDKAELIRLAQEHRNQKE